MSHLRLTEIQKKRRLMYVKGELKAKPLTKSSRKQEKLASQSVLQQSLAAPELFFV